MREVDVPGMRRHVGTLGHVAHVAQVALIHDLPELLFRHPVDLQRRAGIDEFEQRGERRAQVDAAPAPVANVEGPLELGKKLGFVIEIRRGPGDGMAGRSLEAPFTDGHGRMRRAGRKSPAGPLGFGARTAPGAGTSRPGRRGLFESGWHASAPPWRASRTNPLSRRSPPGGPPSPSPDTCPYIRASRPR